MILRIATFSLALLLLNGCDSNEPEDIPITGNFEVTISGALNKTVNGISAAFGASTDPTTGITGFGLTLGSAQGSVTIARRGDRPGNGTYAIEAFGVGTDPNTFDPNDFIATYSEGQLAFTSASGTLTITNSESNVLEGSFTFTADNVNPNTPGQITATGEFTAVGIDFAPGQ